MTDHLQMKGKDALTIEEGYALLDMYPHAPYKRALIKIGKAADIARSRHNTREHMAKKGRDAVKAAGLDPEKMRREARGAAAKKKAKLQEAVARKAGIKIVKEGR